MTSTQDMVRPGESLDLYYYDGETSRKQVFPTTQNTRFVQAFQSATNNQGGSQTFTIPPQNGLQDIVLQFALTVASAPNPSAVPSGWGYALIKQVSFRYGGSSQYFLSGDQILQLALRAQTSRSSVNDILGLGGNALGPAAGGQIANGVYYANCVLTLPHNIPSGVGKSHPFPSDCLTQQVQVTVELYPTLSIVDSNGANTATTAMFSLTSAQFVVQQVMFNNQGDALPRRVDLATNAYAFPAEFCQQKQTITMPTANTTAVQSISLTGFRSGEVKGITVWLTRTSDYNTTNQANKAPFRWYKPLSVQMTYAGEVFARYELGLSSLMALINGNKSPAVDTITTAAGILTVPDASEWVHLPFAQTLVDEDSHYTLVHGKPITNGIVNLDIATPTAQSDWVLNVSYHYNTTLMFSQGTCDYVF